MDRYQDPSGPDEPTYQPIEEPLAEPLAEPAPRASRGRTVLRTLRDAVETVVFTLVIFFVIRHVVQNFRVEGFSMEPTLHPGQYLIVDKVSYRLHDPRRLDIIVFEFPRAQRRDFIKRLIGLPGETVELRGGVVYIEGRPLEEPYLQQPGQASFGPVQVGPGEYFVLGDNRPNSSDSRTWGMLSRQDIIGRAWLSYWPPEAWGPVQPYALANP